MLKCTWRTFTIALVALSTHTAISATLPTGNLLVNLNGDSTGNFLVGGANSDQVQVWYDAAHDGSNASQQDFGQALTANMPTLINHAFPNGSVRPVLNFNRNYTGGGTGTGSAAAGSDFLSSKAPGAARTGTFGGAFAEAADSAYAGISGISWFTVVRTNLAADEADNGGRGSATQTVIRAAYSTPNANTWATIFGDNFTGTDDGTVVDLVGHGRNGDLIQTGNGTPNISANQWYIIGNSWDETANGTGTLRTVIFNQNGQEILDQTVSMFGPTNMTVGDIGTAGGTVRIGRTSASGHVYFSGDLAEVLIYNSALAPAVQDEVMSYLSEKYLVPEPGSFVLAGLALVGVGFARRRWKK